VLEPRGQALGAKDVGHEADALARGVSKLLLECLRTLPERMATRGLLYRHGVTCPMPHAVRGWK
jgi:hypothetical protein